MNMWLQVLYVKISCVSRTMSARWEVLTIGNAVLNGDDCMTSVHPFIALFFAVEFEVSGGRVEQ